MSEPATVANEFASVTVEVVRQGRGSRLRLQDTESGATVSLDPLDLRSFCLADEQEQADWLRFGVYREPAERSDR
ncbi:MAG: hypothetical protein JWR28_3487 [Modestobacter sp.]|jgi:hypothetical protein|nr:hypothetical protein [Modestobacter sp.]MCW2578292.1 hypothetical protein [Modestobacter sp.]MCW2620338.1 hypothetical protein [Modestobacter sp.]